MSTLNRRPHVCIIAGYAEHAGDRTRMRTMPAPWPTARQGCTQVRGCLCDGQSCRYSWSAMLAGNAQWRLATKYLLCRSRYGQPEFIERKWAVSLGKHKCPISVWSGVRGRRRRVIVIVVCKPRERCGTLVAKSTSGMELLV